jgi:hypothetical protein
VRRRKIDPVVGKQALQDFLAGDESSLATATRFLLEEISIQHFGSTVELRVPPYGAIQLLAGPVHKRGTPANVVELDPENFISLATGSSDFEHLRAAGLLRASGTRSNLSDLFPIFIR